MLRLESLRGTVNPLRRIADTKAEAWRRYTMAKREGPECVKCEILQEGDFYFGRCLEADIFTEGETFEETLKNLEEAVALHFYEEKEAPVEPHEAILMMAIKGTLRAHVP